MSVSDPQNSIKERAKIKLARDLGDTLVNALHDPLTIEILLNADGTLWQEKVGLC